MGRATRQSWLIEVDRNSDYSSYNLEGWRDTVGAEITSSCPNTLLGWVDAVETDSAPSPNALDKRLTQEDDQKNREALFVKSNISIDASVDEDLFQKLRSGDKQALTAIFRKYARIVRILAYRLLRDAAEADDLLQEVFLFIFRKAELFDSTKGTARSWIIQVTYHRAFNRREYLISRHFYKALDVEDADAAAALQTEIAFYERTLEGTLGKVALQQMEESLSEDQRRTVQLYFFEGYTIEEIAQEMGQSPGNVRHHYYRALEKMRKLIFPPKLQPK